MKRVTEVSLVLFVLLIFLVSPLASVPFNWFPNNYLPAGNHIASSLLPKAYASPTWTQIWYMNMETDPITGQAWAASSYPSAGQCWTDKTGANGYLGGPQKTKTAPSSPCLYPPHWNAGTSPGLFPEYLGISTSSTCSGGTTYPTQTLTGSLYYAASPDVNPQIVQSTRWSPANPLAPPGGCQTTNPQLSGGGGKNAQQGPNSAAAIVTEQAYSGTQSLKLSSSDYTFDKTDPSVRLSVGNGVHQENVNEAINFTVNIWVSDGLYTDHTGQRISGSGCNVIILYLNGQQIRYNCQWQYSKDSQNDFVTFTDSTNTAKSLTTRVWHTISYIAFNGQNDVGTGSTVGASIGGTQYGAVYVDGSCVAGCPTAYPNGVSNINGLNQACWPSSCTGNYKKGYDVSFAIIPQAGNQSVYNLGHTNAYFMYIDNWNWQITCASGAIPASTTCPNPIASTTLSTTASMSSTSSTTSATSASSSTGQQTAPVLYLGPPNSTSVTSTSSVSSKTANTKDLFSLPYLSFDSIWVYASIFGILYLGWRVTLWSNGETRSERRKFALTRRI